MSAPAMKIGIMAHTHDNPEAFEKAVAFFSGEKVGMVIHAGDFIAPFSLAYMEKLDCPWIGVFGENDGARQRLMKASEQRIQESPYVLNLGGTRVFILYSEQEFELQRNEIEGEGLVIIGEPYVASVERSEGLLIVKPGDASGYVAEKPTVCLFDSSENAGRIVEL